MAIALGPRNQMVAYTTAILSGGVLYATRALRRLVQPRDIGELVDVIGPLGLHVERWIPKTTISDVTRISV